MEAIVDRKVRQYQVSEYEKGQRATDYPTWLSSSSHYTVKFEEVRFTPQQLNPLAPPPPRVPSLMMTWQKSTTVHRPPRSLRLQDIMKLDSNYIQLLCSCATCAILINMKVSCFYKLACVCVPCIAEVLLLTWAIRNNVIVLRVTYPVDDYIR